MPAQKRTCLNCCGVTWLIMRTEFGSREASSKKGLTNIPRLATFEPIASRTLFSSSSFSQESCFLQNWYLVLSRSSAGSAGIVVKGDFSSPCIGSTGCDSPVVLLPNWVHSEKESHALLTFRVNMVSTSSTNFTQSIMERLGVTCTRYASTTVSIC